MKDANQRKDQARLEALQKKMDDEAELTRKFKRYMQKEMVQQVGM